MQKKNFHIISMATYGTGLSGGDRIFIELSKRLAKNFPVSIYLWEEGLNICKRENLTGVKFVIWSANLWSKFGFFINYFARILIAFVNSFALRLDNSSSTIVYSASEFWQDSLPALILKLKHSRIQWLAAWYQTAPNPFFGFQEGDRKVRFQIRPFLYWLVQQPIKPLIKRYADLVIVNNEDERKEFSEMDQKGKVFVMLGAVDLEKINIFNEKYQSLNKVYDGVFQGRFHPQKGVLELVDIWKMVVTERPEAKLAMIGDGPLMGKVRKKIKADNLEDNIKLFGYLFDGPEKYKVFAQSRVVLHPAVYDSGGMASAEAMAFKLPMVGFDMKSYKSYYPKGVKKVRVGDLKEFAKQILKLLDDSILRAKLAAEGLEMLKTNWSWQKRADDLITSISK